MHLYGFDYVPSNSSMNLAFQRQGHSIPVTEIEKMTYFGEITGPTDPVLCQFITVHAGRF